MNGEIDGVNPHVVTIGDHTIIGNSARIITHCPVNPGPVKLGCYVFIGYGATILPNVTIGNGALVGARAVVTKDIPPLTVAVGNPAKIIRKRNLAALVNMIATMKEGISVGRVPKIIQDKQFAANSAMSESPMDESGYSPLQMQTPPSE